MSILRAAGEVRMEARGEFLLGELSVKTWRRSCRRVKGQAPLAVCAGRPWEVVGLSPSQSRTSEMRTAGACPRAGAEGSVIFNCILALYGDDHFWALGTGGPLFVSCRMLSFASHLVSLESGRFLHLFQSSSSLMLCRKMLSKWEFSKPKGLLVMT